MRVPPGIVGAAPKYSNPMIACDSQNHSRAYRTARRVGCGLVALLGLGLATHAADISVPVALNPGWNLVSVPVGTPYSVGAFVAQLPPPALPVYHWDNPRSVYTCYTANPGYAADATFAFASAYWVYNPATENSTVTVTGEPPADRTVHLRAGWNAVGSVYAETLTAAEALRPLLPGRDYLCVWGYENGTAQAYSPGAGGNLQMQPGKGYWVYMCRDVAVTFPPDPETGAANADFIVADAGRLVHRSSRRPYTFSHANQYYLFYKPLPLVDEVFADAQAMGMNVLRTWGFCDGVYADGIAGEDFSLQPQAGVYSERGFARLDYLLWKARLCGLRLILPLVNNWDDFGGMQAYVNWSTTASPLRHHDEFYTDSHCRSTYKDYVTFFLNRRNTLTGIAYKDDPALLIVELANEPRCETDTSGDTLLAWFKDMSALVKGLDANHLVSTGSEGWYNGAGGADFIRHHQLPDIDICSLHLLMNNYGFSETQSAQWLQSHVDDAHFVIGKPVYVGEFGYQVMRDWPSAPTDMATRNRLYADWYQLLLDRAVDGGGFWLLSADSYPDYDHYTVYWPEDTETSLLAGEFSAAMADRRALSYHLPIMLLTDRQGAEQTPLGFAIPRSNPSQLALTFTSPNLPAGATLDGTGYFRWTTPMAGTYPEITVYAAAGGQRLAVGSFDLTISSTRNSGSR